MHGDQLLLHCNKGHLQSFGLNRGHRSGSVEEQKDVSTDSEHFFLMSGVAQQPMSIYFEADQSSFQLYSTGVLTVSCGMPRSK